MLGYACFGNFRHAHTDTLLCCMLTPSLSRIESAYETTSDPTRAEDLIVFLNCGLQALHELFRVGLRVLGLKSFAFVRRGSWDLVIRCLVRQLQLYLLATPITVLITVLTKYHDPPSRVKGCGRLGLRFERFLIVPSGVRQSFRVSCRQACLQ